MVGDYRKLSTHNQMRQEQEIKTRVKLFKANGRWLTTLLMAVGSAVAVQGAVTTHAATTSAPEGSQPGTVKSADPSAVAVQTAKSVPLPTTNTTGNTGEAQKGATTGTSVSGDTKTTTETAAAGSPQSQPAAATSTSSATQSQRTDATASTPQSQPAISAGKTSQSTASEPVSTATGAQNGQTNQSSENAGTVTRVASTNATVQTPKSPEVSAESSTEPAAKSTQEDSPGIVKAVANEQVESIGGGSEANDTATTAQLKSQVDATATTQTPPTPIVQTPVLNWTLLDPSQIELERTVEINGQQSKIGAHIGSTDVGDFYGFPLEFNIVQGPNDGKDWHTYSTEDGTTSTFYERDLSKGADDFEPFVGLNNLHPNTIKYETATAADGTPYLRLTLANPYDDKPAYTETLALAADGSIKHIVTVTNDTNSDINNAKFGTLLDTAIDDVQYYSTPGARGADGALISNGDGSAHISNGNGTTVDFYATRNDTLIAGKFSPMNGVGSDNDIGDKVPVTGTNAGQVLVPIGVDGAVEYETPAVNIQKGASISFEYSERLRVDPVPVTNTPTNNHDELNLTKKVTENVVYVDGDTGNTIDQDNNVQSITFYRTGTAKEYGSQDYNYTPWTTNISGLVETNQNGADTKGTIVKLPKYILESLDGYTVKSIKTSVDGKTVSDANGDVEVTGDNNVVTRTITYTKSSDASTTDGKDVTVTRTIHYVNSDGTKAHDDVVQSITLSTKVKSGTDDVVSYNVKSSDEDGDGIADDTIAKIFTSIDSPVEAGYTPDNIRVDDQNVPLDLEGKPQNLETTVTYLPNNAPAEIHSFTETNADGSTVYFYSGNELTDLKSGTDIPKANQIGIVTIPNGAPGADGKTPEIQLLGDGAYHFVIPDGDGAGKDKDLGKVPTIPGDKISITDITPTATDPRTGYTLTITHGDGNTDKKEIYNGLNGQDGSVVTTKPFNDNNGKQIGITLLINGVDSGTILNGAAGPQGETGAAGASPTITPIVDENGKTIGYTLKVPGQPDAVITNGKDGSTPSFVEIKDPNGNVTGYDIMVDGKKVGSITNGKDGATPDIKTTPITDADGKVIGSTITITMPGKDPQIINVTNGKDGLTPHVKVVKDEDGTTSYEFFVIGEDGKETPIGTAAAPKDGVDGKVPQVEPIKDASDKTIAYNFFYLNDKGEKVSVGKVDAPADGKDGKDGATPTVKPHNDANGNVDGWTFTLNGTDYTVMDGKNGVDGKDGEDGKTPAIDPSKTVVDEKGGTITYYFVYEDGGNAGSFTVPIGGDGGTNTNTPGGDGGTNTTNPGGDGGTNTKNPGGDGGTNTTNPGGNGGTNTTNPGGDGGTNTNNPGGNGGITTTTPGGDGGGSTNTYVPGGDLPDTFGGNGYTTTNTGYNGGGDSSTTPDVGLPDTFGGYGTTAANGTQNGSLPDTFGGSYIADSGLASAANGGTAGTMLASANASKAQNNSLPQTGDADDSSMAVLGVGLTVMEAMMAFGYVRRKHDSRDDSNHESLY